MLSWNKIFPSAVPADYCNLLQILHGCLFSIWRGKARNGHGWPACLLHVFPWNCIEISVVYKGWWCESFVPQWYPITDNSRVRWVSHLKSCDSCWDYLKPGNFTFWMLYFCHVTDMWIEKDISVQMNLVFIVHQWQMSTGPVFSRPSIVMTTSTNDKQ